MTAIIEASGLTKTYGSLRALDGIDLAVPQGSVLGLLGPNGAGKTTAVSILTTLLRPDSGTATVAGADVVRQPHEVRKRIGLAGQNAAVDEQLTGFENLEMIGRLYRMGKARSRERATELLERLSLSDAAHRPAKTYSGGMRRRLDLAGALVAEAPVLFLDEPTTGLDPASRLELWAIIEDLVDRGTTLLLTTQYLDEADHLARDIVVIDHGRIIAQGTPDELKTMVGGERIELSVADSGRLDEAAELLGPLAADTVQIDRERDTVLLPTTGGGAKALTLALRELDGAGIELSDLSLRRPTLDDAFLTLTGQRTDTDGAGPQHLDDDETDRKGGRS